MGNLRQPLGVDPIDIRPFRMRVPDIQSKMTHIHKFQFAFPSRHMKFGSQNPQAFQAIGRISSQRHKGHTKLVLTDPEPG